MKFNALVLSDRRPGHFNQSIGVIERIPNLTFRVIEINFRDKFRDNCLRILMKAIGKKRSLSLFISLTRDQIWKILSFAVEPQTIDELRNVSDIDLIISTGSSIAAINLLCGKLFGAKTVVCLRPSLIGTTHFDLAILPKINWHRFERRNVFRTIGVPNRISAKKLSELRKQINFTDRKRIGILIGGDDRFHTLTKSTAEKIIDQLKKIAENLDLEILITTSRRTPIAIEDQIRSAFKNSEISPICVLASEPSEMENPVQKIFALSHQIIVTEDSFSMVCEAASSGKKVVILQTDRIGWRRSKNYGVYRELVEKFQISWIGVENLKTEIENGLVSDLKIEPLNDSEIAAKAVQNLIGN